MVMLHANCGRLFSAYYLQTSRAIHKICTEPMKHISGTRGTPPRTTLVALTNRVTFLASQ